MKYLKWSIEKRGSVHIIIILSACSCSTPITAFVIYLLYVGMSNMSIMRIILFNNNKYIYYTHTHKRAQTDGNGEWAAKVWDSEKLIVTKGRHGVWRVVRGGVLLCCPLFSFYYTHEFPGLVFVSVCVCDMRWRARRACIEPDI